MTDLWNDNRLVTIDQGDRYLGYLSRPLTLDETDDGQPIYGYICVSSEPAEHGLCETKLGGIDELVYQDARDLTEALRDVESALGGLSATQRVLDEALEHSGIVYVGQASRQLAQQLLETHDRLLELHEQQEEIVARLCQESSVLDSDNAVYIAVGIVCPGMVPELVQRLLAECSIQPDDPAQLPASISLLWGHGARAVADEWLVMPPDEREAASLAMSKALELELTAGFFLDRQQNACGNTGWDFIRDQIGLRHD